MTVTVFGSINIDLTAYTPHLPQPGETLHGHSYQIGLGGKGANQAVAATKLGADTALIGAVGQDAFGQTALKKLKSHDVSSQHVMTLEDADTGIAVIAVDDRAENNIIVVGGANMEISPKDLAPHQERLAATDILMLQLETPIETAVTAACDVKKAGGRVILDPAPAPAKGLPDSLWQVADIITPNETECELLCGIRPTDETSARKAAQQLLSRGASIAVIKQGAKGVYYLTVDGEEGFVPAFTVTAIDTVAAGDCFNGGLAVALDQGQDIGSAVRFAAACGALSTTRQGAADAAPGLQEVTALMNDA